jgi:DNA-binding response OmpR family regulator
MLPDISGEEVCKQMRQQSSVPVLMLTAKVSKTISTREGYLLGQMIM